MRNDAFACPTKPRESFRCKYCNKTYQSSAALTKHVKSQHPNQYAITCDQCVNRSFSTRKALQLHQMRMHNHKHTVAGGDGTDRYLRLVSNRMGELIVFKLMNNLSDSLISQVFGRCLLLAVRFLFVFLLASCSRSAREWALFGVSEVFFSSLFTRPLSAASIADDDHVTPLRLYNTRAVTAPINVHETHRSTLFATLDSQRCFAGKRYPIALIIYLSITLSLLSFQLFG